MPDEPLPPPESQLSEFLREAAPIVAQHRGLSPRAQVLLESLAERLALSPDEYRTALDLIQRGQLELTGTSGAAIADFRRLLRTQLSELQAKILSTRQEQKLIAFGVAKLGLTNESARDEIKLAAASLGIRRIPLDEAIRYLEEVIEKKIGDDETEPTEALPRLHALGRDWGLEAAEVDDLIRYRIEDNIARRQRERLWNRGLIGGAIAAGVVVSVSLLVVVIRSWSSTGPAPEQTTPPENSNDVTQEPRRTKPPAWWDTDLTLAIASLRNERTDFAPVSQALASSDAQRRIQGYDLVFDRAAHQPFDLRAWRPYEDLIAGGYVLDPDDAAAHHIRTRWMELISSVIDRVPDAPADYQAAIAPVELAVKTIKQRKTAPSRRDALLSELTRAVGTSLSADDDETKLRNQALAGLVDQLMEQLPAALEKNPSVILRHWPALQSLGKERVDEAVVRRHLAMLVAEAIRQTPASWRDWQSLIDQAMKVREPIALLKLIDAWERTPDKSLRDHLRSELLSRAGITGAGVPEGQLGAAIRKALGFDPTESTSQSRWNKLVESTGFVLQRAKEKPSTDAAALHLSVALAWHANLAMALGASRPNSAMFDSWLAAGPPGKTPDGPKVADDVFEPVMNVRTSKLTREQQETFDRYIHELGDSKQLSIPQRISYLNGVAKLAERGPEISIVQGRNLASYVLAPKGTEEMNAVADAIPAIRGWRYFRLAVADALERSDLEPSQLARVVLLLTGLEVSGELADRPEARKAILLSVAAELSSGTGESREAPASEVDRWAMQLTNVYRDRAKLFGAAPAQMESALNPSDALRLSVLRIFPNEPAKVSDEFAARMELADPFAASDPQRVVLLQRVLLEASRFELTRRRPSLTKQAAAITSDFVRETAKSPDVLSQIQAGEATLLSLWLLAREE